VLFTLSTEVPVRRGDDIRAIESRYRWPVVHREGSAGPLQRRGALLPGRAGVQRDSRNVKVVFINQFGFERHVCGTRMPADMEFMDIRKGSDAEFGQSIYEPFGHRAGRADQLRRDLRVQRMLRLRRIRRARDRRQADAERHRRGLHRPADKGLPPERLMSIGQPERDQIEDAVAARVAADLIERLPRTPQQFEQFIERGYELAQKMSWDVVARDYVLPGMQRACKAQRSEADRLECDARRGSELPARLEAGDARRALWRRRVLGGRVVASCVDALACEARVPAAAWDLRCFSAA
jgi:hypothetical protein